MRVTPWSSDDECTVASPSALSIDCTPHGETKAEVEAALIELLQKHMTEVKFYSHTDRPWITIGLSKC